MIIDLNQGKQTTPAIQKVADIAVVASQGDPVYSAIYELDVSKIAEMPPLDTVRLLREALIRESKPKQKESTT